MTPDFIKIVDSSIIKDLINFIHLSLTVSASQYHSQNLQESGLYVPVNFEQTHVT